MLLTQLMRDMDFGGDYECFSLQGDNQDSLALANNPISHQRSKHIDVRYHFIRDLVRAQKVILSYVSSYENNADVFTKQLSRICFERCVRKLFG